MSSGGSAKAWRRVFEGGTSESQVFLSQRGEALLNGPVSHLLQCGRVPLGILVLVYQHCKHAEFNNVEEESDDVTKMMNPFIPFLINISFF